MNARRLLIDAGNSSLKWALVEAGQWQARGRVDYADGATLKAQMRPGTECFVASVTAPEREKQLAALLDEAGMKSVWLTAESGFGEVTNTYQNPGQLGVDRWMGLIGARQRTRAPVLVVSVGTAMTVDAMSGEGTFLGGVIVPGPELMRLSLKQGTARVNGLGGEWKTFPKNTADGVQSGIVAALCGVVRQQYEFLAEFETVRPKCLLTGGAAELILPHLSMPAEGVPLLVLEGMACVARERDT
jgi:type III pantothenate kinase